MAEPRRIHLEVEGIVQGVGFRSFLHRLAQSFGLAGWCRNTVFGVELELGAMKQPFPNSAPPWSKALRPWPRSSRSGKPPAPLPWG